MDFVSNNVKFTIFNAKIYVMKLSYKIGLLVVVLAMSCAKIHLREKKQWLLFLIINCFHLLFNNILNFLAENKVIKGTADAKQLKQ